MRFRINHITTKLWLVMTLLVLLILGTAGVTQSRLLEDIYYWQQANQLIDMAHKVEAMMNEEKDPRIIDQKLDLLARFSEANIMVVGNNGLINFCHGLGTSTENMPADINNPHVGPLIQNDLDQLFRGETVVHQGNNPFFGTEVLSVAVPLSSAQNPFRAVLIHAPLNPMTKALQVLQSIIAATAIGGVLLAALISLIFSRFYTQPLLSLKQAAIAMAHGDYSRRVKVASQDELGQLAEAVNTLSANLDEKIQQLHQVDRTRREFLSNVSHELKTPLTIIQAYSEALLDGLAKNTREKTEYLHNIHGESLRLKRLVEEILDLRRMEEGKEDFLRQPARLLPLAMRAVDKFGPIAEEKGIRLEVQLPEELPLLELNEDRMEGVLLNLLDNAVRHTSEGGLVSLRIEQQGEQIVLQVADTGVGIGEEELPLIWDRFYKGDKSRHRVAEGGTGLGLAIVKRVVELHQGRIEVSSQRGQGTVFTVYLPVMK